MHIDARFLENNSLIEGDICIIGAGAAGLSIALELMNTPYKVILLEGGGFQYDDRIQELYSGKTTGQPYYQLNHRSCIILEGLPVTGAACVQLLIRSYSLKDRG